MSVLCVRSRAGIAEPATHWRYGTCSSDAHYHRDDRHTTHYCPADGKHEDGLHRGTADGPASAALRPTPWATSESRLDVDVAADGSRLTEYHRLHHLLRHLRPSGTSRLDDTQQPGLYSHDESAIRVLRVSRSCRHHQNHWGSTQGKDSRRRFLSLIILWKQTVHSYGDRYTGPP